MADEKQRSTEVKLRSIWPFGLILLLLLLVLWIAGAGHVEEATRQEAFLRSQDSADGYLIPVECHKRGRGTYNRDYVIGTAALKGKRWGKEFCLYARPAFDRLYAELVAGDPAKAHQSQADRVGAELKYPSRQETLIGMSTVSIAWAVLFGLAAYYAYRRKRRTIGQSDHADGALSKRPL